MMFILYALALLLLVYMAPAFALFPRLILSSRTIVATPFISIAIIGVAQTVFAFGDIYTQSVVIAFSVTMLLIAVVRLIGLLRSHPMFYWPSTHRFLLLFSVLLGCYWAAELGSGGFDGNDEIYSWNLWAIQHYLGHEVDLFYVRSPYPQLFSILISYGYKLLGSIELQLPVRLLFAIFPVAMWGAIAVAPKEATFANALQSFILMLLLAGAIGRYFAMGLADPLMASSLVVAIFLFIQYRDALDRPELLILSLVCAAVALFTKQAALIWALFSFPVIAIFAMAKQRLPLKALLGSFVLMALGIMWVAGPGSGFQDNQGVINASQNGRGLMEQFIFSVQSNLIEKPLVLLLIVASMIAVFRTRSHRDILLVFLLPALFAWLLFGAYDLRLGIHIVGLSALLLAATAYPSPISLGSGIVGWSERLIRRYSIVLIILVSVFVGGVTISRIYKNVGKIGDNYSPYISGINTISKFFGKDAVFVFTELYDKKDLLLWVPSNYIYGVFYGHTPMMRPDYRGTKKYGPKELLIEIDNNRPDYLFDSGPKVAYGPGSKQLRKLAETYCSKLFEKSVEPPNKYGYTVYRLQNNDALIENCFAKLEATD